MKFKFIMQNSLLIMVIAASALVFAEKPTSAAPSNASSIASREATSIIQFYNKSFDFNWNDDATIAPNKAKVAKIESLLIPIKNILHLSAADSQALGELYYKLGAYYAHVARQPNQAIEKLNAAKTLLTRKSDKNWNYNQLAYAYELKFAASGEKADRDQALSYVDKVISDKKDAEVAFADCVKGLVFNDAKDYPKAEASYQKALKIYESLPSGKDDQYARAKNRLANIILDEDGRDQEALAMLIELNQYWLSKPNIAHDPYAARNFITLGKAYLKVEDAEAARNAFNSAIQIDREVYGSKSAQLAQPYKLLSDAYNKLGNQQLASSYQQKANALPEE